ncbi:hypothetical protein AWC38_SpisGene4101 [Stylophora pistillata]|uniref:DNA/RNA non-specific endonuclease domain-containing protein n=1 Tax=Stylophora pistillata TaxID=50429 RepID=A0A2B4SMG5_STYPI|nr:hypothetical protein AWC38_SpisGene4101 [Stylophora pistillata]
MEEFTTSFLFLVVIEYLLNEVAGQQCSTIGIDGIDGCQCTFMEACDEKGKPKSTWPQYLPTGVDQFGLVHGGSQNLAYLCEDSAVAILYDCNNRIPLYAATVIEGAQLLGRDSGRRPPVDFRRSSLKWLYLKFQQALNDYFRSNNRELCYATKEGGGRYLVDRDWVISSGHRSRFRTDDCPGGALIKTVIHRGHLIASRYGRRNQAKKRATFTYTNAVPQFGLFNSHPWQVCEGHLVMWGTQNCAEVKGATNVQLFIVVGAMPSTIFRPSTHRYFGEKGFSDYIDNVYRVNVPKHLWTAACCKYKAKRVWKYHSTAFKRENNPGMEPCVRTCESNSHLRLLPPIGSEGTCR